MTKRDTAVKISTPCTRNCKLINDHCVSCGRTWFQIRDWSFYSEDERILKMKELKPNKNMYSKYNS